METLARNFQFEAITAMSLIERLLWAYPNFTKTGKSGIWKRNYIIRQDSEG